MDLQTSVVQLWIDPLWGVINTVRLRLLLWERLSLVPNLSYIRNLKSASYAKPVFTRNKSKVNVAGEDDYKEQKRNL